jgi:hypothetical protein
VVNIETTKLQRVKQEIISLRIMPSGDCVRIVLNFGFQRKEFVDQLNKCKLLEEELATRS